ncbi:MAG: GAF domain-containing protein, partial [Deltaproteobacteria bacterium]|nr:GAF domain-containing protein [Deltaproteobacteria bacterium]
MDSTAEKIGNSSEKKNTLQEQLEYQKRLNNITNKIHSARDTDDILLNLQGEILGLFDADRITIYVVDSIKTEIVSRLKTGDEVSEIRVPINNGSISGYSAASGKVVNILDVSDQDELKRIDPQLKFDKSWDQLTGYKTTQVLAAPIVHNKFVQGVIQLINKRTGQRFTEADQSSVLDIATVLGAAFFKNKKVAEKTKSTRFDLLVGQNIISHDELVEAMTRARKKKTSVEAVLMADFHVLKDDIGKSLSEFYRARFIPYDDKMVIPGQLLKGLKVNFLKNNNFVPVAQSEDTVVVAME